jgi:hypothetical protein
MSLTNYQKERLTEAISTLVAAERVHVRRTMDAAACQTRGDYQRARDAEAELCRAQDELDRMIADLAR